MPKCFLVRHKKLFKINGTAAALVIVVLLVSGIAHPPFTSVDDAGLRRAVEQELRARRSRELLPELRDAVAAMDRERAARAAASLNGYRPRVTAMSYTRPLLRSGRNHDLIVQAEIAEPDGVRTVYLRCRWNLITGWDVRGKSTRLLYYLNLL